MIGALTDFVWSYILVVLLVGLGLWFTLASRFVQFRFQHVELRFGDDDFPFGLNRIVLDLAPLGRIDGEQQLFFGDRFELAG